MKKLITVSVLSFALIGCGSGGGSDSQPVQPSKPTPVTPTEPVIPTPPVVPEVPEPLPPVTPIPEGTEPDMPISIDNVVAATVERVNGSDDIYELESETSFEAITQGHAIWVSLPVNGSLPLSQYTINSDWEFYGADSYMNIYLQEVSYETGKPTNYRVDIHQDGSIDCGWTGHIKHDMEELMLSHPDAIVRNYFSWGDADHKISSGNFIIRSGDSTYTNSGDVLTIHEHGYTLEVPEAE